jgi:hypothetical protein
MPRLETRCHTSARLLTSPRSWRHLGALWCRHSVRCVPDCNSPAVVCVCFPSHNMLLVTHDDQNEVLLWDLTTGNSLRFDFTHELTHLKKAGIKTVQSLPCSRVWLCALWFSTALPSDMRCVRRPPQRLVHGCERRQCVCEVVGCAIVVGCVTTRRHEAAAVL